MPGMVAFGRRWLIATDDFIIIGVIDSVVYSMGAAFSGYEAYKWFSTDARNFCDNPVLYDVAFAYFFVYMMANFIFGLIFAIFSTRGTIFQVEPRWPCTMAFHIKMYLLFPTSLWVALAAYLLHGGDFCNSDMKQTLVIETVLGTSIYIALLAFMWMLYDDEGSISKIKTKKRKLSEANFFLGPVPRRAVKKWKFRFFALFYWTTSPSQAKKDAINTVSEILAYVSHELDIVFSDFAAGVILMKQKHFSYYKKEEAKLDSCPAITLRDGTAVDCFPTTDMPSWMNLHLAKRYFHIGLGVFGWRWTIYRNFACGLCSLWNLLVCCFPCRKATVVEGDNCCGCNIAGLLLNSDVPYKDLVHVSFHNKVYVIPFFVAVDPDTSAVVITTRGTMSLNDILTDLAAGLVPMENETGSPDIYCHAGMLKTAQRIRDKLEDSGILEAAFKGRESYHLVTTGHSLGASVSTLLALLLRPSYPSVRCYAFEPPPCISANGLRTTKDCIFSVVFGNDIVPYLSVRNVDHMIQEVVQCARECNLRKHEVFFYELPEYDENSDKGVTDGKISSEICTEVDATKKNQQSENKDSKADNMENGTSQQEDKTGESDAKNEEVAENNLKHEKMSQEPKKTDLYIPGRILHVKYSKNGYRLQVRTAEDFHPLMIRPDMVMHHFPQYIGGCLEQLGHTYTLLSLSL